MSGADPRDRFRGALVGTTVGDGLGAHFEGWPSVTSDDVEAVEVESGEWRFTDDTHMTFVLAESLAEHGGLVPERLAVAFAQAWSAEPGRGYGPGPPQVFRRILGGDRWDEPARGMFGGSGSFGNGAAMRSAPAALFAHPDVTRAVEVARTQALVTHAHPLGLDGAGVQAAAVALALSSKAPPGEWMVDAVTDHAGEPAMRAALQAVRDLVPGGQPDDVVAAVGHGIEAVEAVPAALACTVLRPDSFEDALRFALRIAGDTDTIAAMAGAIAGAFHGVEAVPKRWRARAEGVAHGLELADRLWEAAGRP